MFCLPRLLSLPLWLCLVCAVALVLPVPLHQR